MLIKSLPVPPKGWNSYDSFGGSITEEEALANLEVFLKRLAPFGFDYFCIDAAWYMDGGFKEALEARRAGKTRKANIDEYGVFRASTVNFPSGLRSIADRCHAAGVKFGLHVFRGLLTAAYEQNTPVKGHPMATARSIADLSTQCPWCSYIKGINMDSPGAQEYYNSVAEYLLNELKVDFIKLDDAYGYPREIAAFAKALQRLDRPVVLSISPGNSTSAITWNEIKSYANMVRITADVWDRDEDIYAKFDRWLAHENLAGEECWIDLDMIPIGGIQANVPKDTKADEYPILGCRRKSNLSENAKEVMMTQYALSCSALIYGGDLPMSDDDDFAYVTNKDVLDCNNNGVVAKQVAYFGYYDVRLARRKGDGRHGWFGIFHREGFKDGETRDISFTARDLGFEDGFPQSMYDVWEKREILPECGKITLKFRSRGCHFLRF